MMKKTGKTAVILTLILLLASFAVALEVSAGLEKFNAKTEKIGYESSYKYIWDSFDVLTDDEEAELNTRLQTLSDKYGMDFVFISVATAGNSDYERNAFAEDFYDYSDYRDDGVLYMYEEATTYKYICTSGKAQKVISYELTDSVLDDVDYYTDRGRYYESVNEFISDMELYVGSYDESGEIYYEREKYADHVTVYAVISVIAALIIAGVAKSNEKKKLNTVAPKAYAGDYVLKNSLNITGGGDLYLYSTVTKVRRATDSGNRGGGGRAGGGHTHIGSSGASHGGGGRH